MSNSPLVLGIDAGGTKTAAAIGSNAAILGYGKSGPGNLRSASAEDVQRHLQRAVTQAMAEAKQPATVSLASVVVGMSGVDTDTDLARAHRLVKRALRKWITRKTLVQVVNDIHIVQRSGTDKPYGIALIAGTGSHGFGSNRKGETAHVSGLGHTLADEGSGYWIGLKALQAAAKSYDGRSKPTVLQQVVCKHFAVETVRDVLTKLPSATKADIAALALPIEDAAVAGDWAATAILEAALDELELQATTLIKKLRLQRSVFDMVVVGGMFHMPHYPFLKKFTRRVKHSAPKATVIYPTTPPVVGAVRLAQDSLQP